MLVLFQNPCKQCLRPYSSKPLLPLQHVTKTRLAPLWHDNSTSSIKRRAVDCGSSAIKRVTCCSSLRRRQKICNTTSCTSPCPSAINLNCTSPFLSTFTCIRTRTRTRSTAHIGVNYSWAGKHSRGGFGPLILRLGVPLNVTSETYKHLTRVIQTARNPPPLRQIEATFDIRSQLLGSFRKDPYSQAWKQLLAHQHRNGALNGENST